MNRNENEIVQTSLENLSEKWRPTEILNLHEETLEETEEDQKVRGKYVESPYYLHFMQIYLEVKDDIKDDDEDTGCHSGVRNNLHSNILNDLFEEKMNAIVTPMLNAGSKS